MIDPSTPTLANGGAPAPPPVADPGEFGPSATPSPKTFEQQRAAQDAAKPADKPAASAAEPTADPDAPAKFKVGKYETTEGELAAMMERQALDDLRKATVPPTPADYKLAIPENMKLPGDLEFRFDEAGNKSSFDAARAWAHNRGMSQAEFSEMLGIYASSEAQQQATLAERSRQEIEKVGHNAPQRVDALSRWIVGMVGEKDAAPIKATIVTDAHVRFYEKIISQLTSQGGASFSSAHRVPPDAPGIPGYANMSFEERRYAQDQQIARNRGR